MHSLIEFYFIGRPLLFKTIFKNRILSKTYHPWILKQIFKKLSIDHLNITKTTDHHYFWYCSSNSINFLIVSHSSAVTLMFSKEWIFSIRFYFFVRFPPPLHYFLLNCLQSPSALHFVVWKLMVEIWNCKTFSWFFSVDYNIFNWENTLSKLRANSTNWEILSVLIFLILKWVNDIEVVNESMFPMN